jgi:hypothetical protein
MIAVVAAAFWASSSYNISVYYAQGSTAFSPAKPRGGTTRRSAVAAAHIVQLVHWRRFAGGRCAIAAFGLRTEKRHDQGMRTRQNWRASGRHQRQAQQGTHLTAPLALALAWQQFCLLYAGKHIQGKIQQQQQKKKKTSAKSQALTGFLSPRPPLVRNSAAWHTSLKSKHTRTHNVCMPRAHTPAASGARRRLRAAC